LPIIKINNMGEKEKEMHRKQISRELKRILKVY
jgi:hypothetical protein